MAMVIVGMAHLSSFDDGGGMSSAEHGNARLNMLHPSPFTGPASSLVIHAVRRLHAIFAYLLVFTYVAMIGQFLLRFHT
jgi:hypothetical protein